MARQLIDITAAGDREQARSLGDLLKGLRSLGGSLADISGRLQAVQKAARQTSTATGKLKRTLLGFDEIYRLSGTGTTVAAAQVTQLRDLGPVSQSLQKLKDAVEPLTRELFSGLDWAWKDLLKPMGQWSSTDALPGDLDKLNRATAALGTAVGAVRNGLSWLWGGFLAPMQTWTGGPVSQGLVGIREQLAGLGDWVRGSQGALEGMAASERAAASAAGALQQSLGTLHSPLSAVSAGVAQLSASWGQVGPKAKTALNTVQSAWGTVGNWLRGQVLTPVEGDLQGMLNGIIGYFNGALSGVQGAINAVVKAANGLGFTVPSWIPVIGGKRFGFDLQTVALPQIPYLAQGAVLPANKPFLAVVGDQKNGTNVEAPLTTIQQAVALVMEDQTAAILAGFEASTQVQREILEAVLGISIGDEVIARAADRYHAKLAVVTGGVL